MMDVDRRATLKGGAIALAATAIPADAAPKPADFTLALPGGVLTLYALSPRALRVRFAPDRAPPPLSTILLPQKKRPRTRITHSGNTARLALPLLRCEVRMDDGALSFFDAQGKLLLADAGRRLEPSTLHGEKTFIAEQRFVSPPDERLYGTGQFQDGFLDIRGLCRRLTQVNTQISLPFLLSSKGYGLLWHNTGLVDFNPADTVVTPARLAEETSAQDVNVTTTGGNAKVRRSEAAYETTFHVEQSGRYRCLLDTGQAMAHRHYVEIDAKVMADASNLWLPPTTSFFAELSAGEHRLKVLADAKDNPSLHFGLCGDDTTLRSPVAEAVDYVVIAGPQPDDIIAGYRALTGEAPMMPKWAFGYIHCRERFHSSAEILENAREFRARNIPMDVMVQDWQYWGRYGWNAMRFDEKDYPDPAAMIGELHGMNARLMLSVWSKIDPQSDVGKAFTARGCFIPGTTWIDFFNRRTANTYWGAMSHNLLSLGVDAWWQDATEPENDDLVGRVTAAGLGEKVRLQYPLEVTRAVYEGQRRDAPGRRVMILTRSAFLGEQRYAAATWSGDIGYDWDTLRRQIPAGLNMMAAGHPYWTVDAGGFFRPGDGQYSDPVYHEIFLRWLQYATFLPLQRVHGYQTQTEPWRYGPDMERRVRDIIAWRYRLLPYIYSAASEVTRKGSSLMRPLVMDFPGDSKALDQRHAYMFGKALHVAPVIKPGMTNWEVYLPEVKGGWYDFWTDQYREGGKTHAVEATLERIPVHARAGSIVPLGPVVPSTADAKGNDITLMVYAGADGRFELYEDEGTNYGYEKGAFSIIAITWTDAARTLHLAAPQGRFPGMLRQRRFTVKRIAPGGAKEVSVAYSGKAVNLTL